jgi:hypothetical protein
MPFSFDPTTICPTCPHGLCFEDRRVKLVRGRSTQFRLKQSSAMACTFDGFLPGTDNDPDPNRTFDEYLAQFRRNVSAAGAHLVGYDFAIAPPALSKVEGDVFEMIEAAALWNACAAWNSFMETGVWRSKVFVQPPFAVATPTRKVAIVKLPRGYDSTKLFKPEVRSTVLAHEAALKARDMELGLSSPDVVGLRVPYPAPTEYDAFNMPLINLGEKNRELLEGIHRTIEGTLDGQAFLFALAIKRTTRSDRLYQPLFEANILKYLIEVVLRGASFRFYVHMGSFEGADVEGHYRAASLISLMRGGEPTRAITALYQARRPVEAAQSILNDLVLFPI